MRKLPEEPCRTILEISLYQLLCTRIPSYAVVNSAADLTRQQGFNDRVKFVNAVLRNAVRATLRGCPCDRPNAPPQWIRINLQKTSVEELMAKLGLQEAKVLFDRYILVPSARNALKNPLFEKGYYSFQDPASFFAAKMLGAKPNDKIWDACAAPGGKTAMLAEENPEAFFMASDCSEKRAKKLLDLQNRLCLRNVHIAIAAAENPPFSREFDFVIADAPCSNLGVAGRRPEALQSISKEKIFELAKKQLAILQGVSKAVKPGGAIVYCVCSQEKEETSDVIEKFLKVNSNFAKEESIFTDLPDIDGFFMAKLRKAL
jgi:16S rRNA (cytosine967-C5)-methyltransferase